MDPPRVLNRRAFGDCWCKIFTGRVRFLWGGGGELTVRADRLKTVWRRGVLIHTWLFLLLMSQK